MVKSGELSLSSLNAAESMVSSQQEEILGNPLIIVISDEDSETENEKKTKTQYEYDLNQNVEIYYKTQKKKWWKAEIKNHRIKWNGVIEYLVEFVDTYEYDWVTGNRMRCIRK